MSKNFFLVFWRQGGGGGEGKANRLGQLAPGGEDNQGGGKISRDILPPPGPSCPGGQDILLHRVNSAGSSRPYI